MVPRCEPSRARRLAARHAYHALHSNVCLLYAASRRVPPPVASPPDAGARVTRDASLRLAIQRLVRRAGRQLLASVRAEADLALKRARLSLASTSHPILRLSLNAVRLWQLALHEGKRRRHGQEVATAFFGSGTCRRAFLHWHARFAE